MKKLSIRFYPDARHVDAFKCAKLLCRVRLDREDVNIYSLGIKAFVPQWSAEQQRMTGKDFESAAVNTEVSKFELKIRQAYNRCLLGGSLTPVDLRMAVDENYGRSSGTILSYLRLHREFQAGRKSGLSPATLRIYDAVERLATQYLETSGAGFAQKPVTDIGLSFMRGFADFLCSKVSNSTAALYCGKLQAIGDWIVESGGCSRQPFPNPKIKVRQSSEQKLSYEDWLKFCAYRPHTPKALQAYLISKLQVFTGLAIGDAMSLMWTDIQEIGSRRFVVKHRMKNHRAGQPIGKTVIVPVLDQAQVVLDELKRINGNSLLVCPRISDDTVSRRLKAICQEIQIPALNTHDMRKIYTNFICKRAGVSGAALSTSLGHSSTSTTERFYLKDDLGQISGEFEKIQEFLNKAL